MHINFPGNIDRFTGFAQAYDRYRPKPPSDLAFLLSQLAKVSHPTLVVDLGSGTGLSTRYWANKAKWVIGIEPNREMRQLAEVLAGADNVSYREGLSHDTGLPGNCAQIVTCSQAMHWMEPHSTFLEAARILQPGGVFAAYDYDWPPTSGNSEADEAIRTFMAAVEKLESGLVTDHALHRWRKMEHLSKMQASGCFRHTKEITMHYKEVRNTEEVTGLIKTHSGVMKLLKNDKSERAMDLSALQSTLQHALGTESNTWYWVLRMRVGIV